MKTLRASAGEKDCGRAGGWVGDLDEVPLARLKVAVDGNVGWIALRKVKLDGRLDGEDLQRGFDGDGIIKLDSDLGLAVPGLAGAGFGGHQIGGDGDAPGEAFADAKRASRSGQAGGDLEGKKWLVGDRRQLGQCIGLDANDLARRFSLEMKGDCMARGSFNFRCLTTSAGMTVSLNSSRITRRRSASMSDCLAVSSSSGSVKNPAMKVLSRRMSSAVRRRSEGSVTV